MSDMKKYNSDLERTLIDMYVCGCHVDHLVPQMFYYHPRFATVDVRAAIDDMKAKGKFHVIDKKLKELG